MMVASLAVGGVHAQTQVGLAAAVLLLIVLHGIASGGLRWVPFTSVAFLAVGLSVLDIVPLPSGLVRFLSPHAFELRSEVGNALPSFMPLSLDVPATILEICKGLMYTGVLAVVGRCAARDRRARWFLISISSLGVVLALIAVVQRGLHTDTILGLYRVQSLPGSFVFGTFVNGNHAASVLTLAALISLGLAFETTGGGRLLSVAAAGISAAALLFTLSRGGAASLVGGGFVLVFMLLSRRYGRWRGLILALVIAAAASFAVLALGDGVRGRLLHGDGRQLWDNQKTHGWKAAWQLVRAYPWTGVGRGAFEAPATAYRLADEGVRLVYPENLLLQVLTEWGVLATVVLGVMFVIPCGRLARRLVRQEPAVLAAGCGVLAVMFHDLLDFGLEIPGVALPTVVALGVVAGSVYRGRGAAGDPKLARMSIPTLVIAGSVWIAALVGGAWAAGRTLTEDGMHARDAVSEKSPTASVVVNAALARHPADYYLELMAAIDQMHAGTGGVLHHLNRALRLNPASGQSHALTGRWLARLGHRPQAALEFRLAREHGVVTEFDDIFAAVGPAIVDAVPQQPSILRDLSQHLSASGHSDAAERAARRAVECSEHPDGEMVNVVDIAMATGEPPRMIRAAHYVLAQKPGTTAVVAAARALFRAGEKTAAGSALDAALERIPDDPAFILSAAGLHVEFKDPTAARNFLTRNSGAQQHFHLADLVSLQQLLVQIADQMGDANAAIIARARGRMFSQRLSESQQTMGLTGGETSH